MFADVSTLRMVKLIRAGRLVLEVELLEHSTCRSLLEDCTPRIPFGASLCDVGTRSSYISCRPRNSWSLISSLHCISLSPSLSPSQSETSLSGDLVSYALGPVHLSQRAVLYWADQDQALSTDQPLSCKNWARGGLGHPRYLVIASRSQPVSQAGSCQN